MSKRVEITPQIEAQIRASVGDPELNVSNFAVYECRMLSTEPISQSGFYSGARASVSTLKDMEAYLSQPGNARPLQIMHETQFLPVGKVFSAKVYPTENGETEVRGMFYMAPTKTDLIADLDNSIISEVSVGLLCKHAFCSECDFDFFGEEADITHFMDRTCENGHTLGKDGTFLRLVGLEKWAELSLVNNGAAKKAKILPRSQQSMSKDMVERLAASGKTVEQRFLSASYEMETVQPQKGEVPMSAEFEALMAQYTAQTTELAQAKVDLKAATDSVTALSTEVTSLKASLEAKDTEIAGLKASADKTDDQVKKELEETKTELAEAKAVIAPHAKAALVASGVAEADVPEDLKAMTKMIEEKGLKLHQIVGSGAQSSGTKTDDQLKAKADEDRRKGSFKV